MDPSVTKAYLFQKQILAFASGLVIWVSRQQIPYSIIDQVVRSATSIGANYSEALNASSKTDFRNKIYIAKKEAAETKYWLELIGNLKPAADNKQLAQECQHLLMILQKTVNTLNAKRSKIK